MYKNSNIILLKTSAAASQPGERWKIVNIDLSPHWWCKVKYILSITQEYPLIKSIILSFCKVGVSKTSKIINLRKKSRR
jgi:hypothetical protein